MLYIGLGDGGRSYDQAGTKGYGQDLTSYLGKILRVNVSDFTIPTWTIPNPISIENDSSVMIANPFANTPNALDEIWSYGLRNPWRFSFDRQTGDLYIADVGQNAYEEANYEAYPTTTMGSSNSITSFGGTNYGWCICEANQVVSSSKYRHCAPTANLMFQGCNVSPLVGPIIEYPYKRGASITGGYVYRGPLYPNLTGVYFYADYVQGKETIEPR